MKIVDLDLVFLSYDEPNADFNYADLCKKIPWAQRVHGIKGSDKAHKVAADHSETEWFVTIDADNIVSPSFFDLEIDTSNPKIQIYSWLGENVINGLQYGNGGLKIWKKDFVINMKTHEASDSERAQVDFCWEDGYKQFKKCFSTVHVNATPFQAWRAGFREGVKMTLFDGIKVPPQELAQKIWWHNIHRLKMWATVGSHVDNGNYAVLGARQGMYMTNCTDWDYVQVRDFEILRDIYNETVEPLTSVKEKILELGNEIKYKLGFDWPYLNPEQSEYTRELYKETIDLGTTYFNTEHV